MKPTILILGIVLASSSRAFSGASAQDMFAQPPGYCEPGYQWVPETVYREVECPVCKVVPNMRKKWVYCSKPDYFCVPALHGACKDGACAACSGPYRRELLLKKQIEYQCGTKCVVEMVQEKVPYTVWKKVPCPSQEAPSRQGPIQRPGPERTTGFSEPGYLPVPGLPFAPRN
jgi:hypothetical protein